MNNKIDAEFILELQKQFFVDCRDLFTSIENSLMELEKTHSNEQLKSLLRGLHSVKGGARAVGFDSLANYVHEIESQLNQLKNSIDINLFLRKLDLMVEHINLMEQDKKLKAETILKLFV